MEGKECQLRPGRGGGCKCWNPGPVRASEENQEHRVGGWHAAPPSNTDDPSTSQGPGMLCFCFAGRCGRTGPERSFPIPAGVGTLGIQANFLCAPGRPLGGGTSSFATRATLLGNPRSKFGVCPEAGSPGQPRLCSAELGPPGWDRVLLHPLSPRVHAPRHPCAPRIPSPESPRMHPKTTPCNAQGPEPLSRAPATPAGGALSTPQAQFCLGGETRGPR